MSGKGKLKRKWKFWIPGILILLSVALNMIARVCEGFSDLYVTYIFPCWVETYGRITGCVPFSAGEWMLYLAVALVLVFAVGSVTVLAAGRRLPRQIVRKYKNYALFLYWTTGIVSMVMTLNCFLLYQVSPVYERYPMGGSPDKKYGIREIGALRDYVVEQANALAPVFERDEQGNILYRGDMKERAIKEMKRLGERFDALEGFYPKPKGLYLSGFYSQQYIMGYYFPFSMEANYNRQMYITNLPVTMCHELSHLKGFLLEDEANFIGYLACIDSEDALFRYSACLSVIGYLDRDFRKAAGEDEALYLSHPQISDLAAWDKKFLTPQAWEQVERKAVLSTETVKQAADAFLETNLTLNGVEDGTLSYSRVVTLLLQYYDGRLY